MGRDAAVPATTQAEARDKHERAIACAKMEGVAEWFRTLPSEELRQRLESKLREVYGTGSCIVEGGSVIGVYLDGGGRKVRWLDPLRGLPLKSLSCQACAVTDLRPLRGMPLTSLGCRDTHISDLAPLNGMPLAKLNCSYTQVRDLSCLRGMPLTILSVLGTPVTDLGPLAGSPLESLNVVHTGIADLGPLRRTPLKRLQCMGTPVDDLTPLEGIQLELLLFSPTRITKGMDAVRRMTSMRQIGADPLKLMNPEEFWRRYDAGEFSK